MKTLLVGFVRLISLLIGLMGFMIVIFPTNGFERWDQLLGAGFLLSISWTLHKCIVLSKKEQEEERGSEGWSAPIRILFFVLLISVPFTAWHDVRNLKNPDPKMAKPSIPSLAPIIKNYLSPNAIQALADGEHHGKLPKKAVVLDVETKSLHPLHMSLPRKIRAKNINDVKTVIYIESEKVPHGEKHFVDGILPIFKKKWCLTMIDITKNSTVEYKRMFYGEDFPDARMGFGEDDGGDRVVAWNMTGDRYERILGAEIIFGNTGGLKTLDGRRVTGVVGPPSWDDALES